MSGLQELVTAWFVAESWPLRHVARNLLLDSPTLDEPEHPDFEECGDRLSLEAVDALDIMAADLAALLSRLQGSFDEPEEIWMEMRRRLEHESRMLRRRIPESVAEREGRAEMVTYVSCRRLHDYWLYPSSDSAGTREPARVRERVTVILDHPSRMDALRSPAPGPTAAPLWLTAPGRVVWVTDGGPDAPHLRPGIEELEGHERALATVCLMGLSGYDGREARRRAIGLIAARYPLEAPSLRTPNAVTALDNPHFFPGYKRETRGRVASLADDMSSPWQRTADNSTVPEWIHQNLTLEAAQPTIELVGFFDD